MYEPKTLSEMMVPLMVANFLVGTGALPGQTTFRKIISFIYSVICLIVFGSLTKLTITYAHNYYWNKANDFGRMTFQAIFYVNIILTFCLIIAGWLKIKIMQTAFMRISMCEKFFEQMEIRKKYRNMYLYQIYSLGSVILVCIIFFVMNYTTQSTSYQTVPLHVIIIGMIVGHYPVIILFVADISFLHWVRYSKIRFKQLNDLLLRMLTTTPDSPQHKRVLKMKDEWNKTFVASATQKDHRTKDNAVTMRNVKQAHLELTKSTRTANEAYGIQILLSMTVSFVFITSLLYDAYKIYWLDISSEQYWQDMVSVMCWALFYASKVFLINHMCALTSIEAADTGDIICELYEPSTSKEFRAEIRDFTLQLIQNPLIFTACGFFNLDHTFIHGVIGSITTYLVILIQVGDIQEFSNSTMTYNLTNFTIGDIL